MSEQQVNHIQIRTASELMVVSKAQQDWLKEGCFNREQFPAGSLERAAYSVEASKLMGVFGEYGHDI